MNKTKLSACFIGDSSLTLLCCKDFRKSGHKIKAIVSSNKDIITWAYEENLPIFRNLIDFESSIIEKSFDYLFSIVNHEILTQKILSLPKEFSINYHDAPLPSYAGIHATSWAILNKESHHGVTWHVVSDIVDAGDIIVNSAFPIADNSTAYELNVTCYENALRLFNDMIPLLEKKNYSLKKQDLVNRTYFSAQLKPNHFAVINWNHTANDILRLYRGLDFSSYANTLALPKIYINNSVVIPYHIEMIPSDITDATPGEIIELSTHGIRIRTGEDDILLIEAKDFNGNIYSSSDVISQFSIKVGDILPSINQSDITLIEAYGKQTFKAETALKNAIEKAVLPDFLFNHAHLKFSSCRKAKLNMAQLRECSKKYDISIKHAIISLLLSYLYKINNYDQFDIFLEDTTSTSEDIITRFFAKNDLTRLALTDNDQFIDIINHTKNMLDCLDKKQVISKDFYIRNKIDTIKSTFNIVLADSLSNLNEQLPLYQYKPIFFVDIKNGEIAVPTINDLSSIEYALFNKVEQRLDKIGDIFLNSTSTISQFNVLLPDEFPIYPQESNNNNNPPHFLEDLFTKAANKHPDKIALKQDEYTISYFELNLRAEFLSKQILGTARAYQNGTVAIYLEKSINFVISMIAVLKAGMAYVPIDPNQPKTRSNYIIQDANPDLVISTTKHKSHFTCKTPKLFLDTMASPAQCPTNLDTNNRTKNKDSLAYIIYTSGTTGQPKGVKISHNNIIKLFESTQNLFKFGENEVWTLFHSIGFDFSVWEIWGALINGNKLLIVPDQAAKSVNDFYELLLKENVTILNQTPSYFNRLVDHINSKKYFAKEFLLSTRLKYIIFGGERLEPSRLKTFFSYGLPTQLINMYGITETTIHATFQKVTPYLLSEYASIPIGFPLKHLRFYLLDSKKQLVQPGLIAEICIAGESVTEGYINKEYENSTRFSNFSIENNQERIYHSGDLAKNLTDVGYFYINRKDKQVKIRGYRIELSEIDSHLEQLDYILQSYSVIKKSGESESHIITYVIIKEGSPTHDLNQAINAYLKEKIPNYMLPKSIHIVPNFPLNQNGKIDTTVLPTTKATECFKEYLTNSDHDEQQKLILKILHEVLHVDHINLSDNFFNLGCSSLQFTEIILKLEKVFNIQFSYAALFNMPTVNNIYRLINSRKDPIKDKKIDLDFIKYAALDKEISPLFYKESKKLFNPSVLLTGATGYFGAFLLKEVIKATDRVYVLIRDNEQGNAFAQFKKIYKKAFNTYIPDYVKPIYADLQKKDLGLSKEAYHSLASDIDVIIHNAAYVNHLIDFSQLKETNVDGTKALLKLSVHKKPKYFHYISTLSALIDSNTENELLESFPRSIENINRLTNGYAQVKWVTENLLGEAHLRGIPVNIYRPGWIIGDLKSHCLLKYKNHLLSFIETCIEMNSIPESDGFLDITPADFLASMIVSTALSKFSAGNVFNYTNPQKLSWHDFSKWLKKYNPSLITLPYKQWKDELLTKCKPSSPLYPFLPLYLNTDDIYILEQSPNNIQHKNVDNILTYCSASYPIIDNAFLDKSFLSTPFQSNNIMTYSLDLIEDSA